MLDNAYIKLYADCVLAFVQRYNWRKDMSYPAGTKQKGSIGALDAGGEKASVSFFLTLITAANEVAQTAAWAGLMTYWDALFLGARYRDEYNDLTTYAVSRPTNGAAREISLKLIARDATTGQTVNYYCPTVNQALIVYDPNYGAKDVVDLVASAELSDFITSLESVGLKNPYVYANAMTIVGAQVVKGQR